MQRTRQSDYRALTLSLSHRSFMVGLRYSPWYIRGLFLIRCVATKRSEKDPSYDTERIAKDSDKSSSG